MVPGLTIRGRIEAALRHEPVDQIPFTIYPGMIPAETAEARRLRTLGLGIMSRQELVVSEAPNVKAEWVEYEEEGTRFGRRRLLTPVGEVYSTHRLGAAYGSSWYVDHFIKRPEDYRAVEYWVRDIVHRPSYDGYYRAQQEIGEEGYVSGNFGYSPLMEMRVNLLGIERFATDQFDYPELFHSLLQALIESQRKAYPLLAESPAEVVIYCGNCVPEVLGKGFAQYCVPCYDELGALLNARGKKLGCHLDANNAYWAKAVEKSRLEVIEAFTPAPDTDLTLAQARAAWPKKVLWINYPSSSTSPRPRTSKRRRAT